MKIRPTPHRWLRCLLAGAGVAVLGLSALHAENYPTKPKDVLEKFLALDADAAGISAATWPELTHYTTWPDFPGWENFVIIDHYTVGNVLEGSTRAQATVVYQPLGQLSETFTADTKPETVVFHLNKVQDQWKVDSPESPPHVAYLVIKKRLDAASAADPKKKAANDQLLNQIEAARRQIHQP